MSHHAHGTNHNHGHATRSYAIEPVRTVQVKRKPLGWLECNVDEFVRLLALHESGKINLLQMPETSADDCDDETVADGTQSAEETKPRRLETVSRNMASTGMVRQALGRSHLPLTASEIARTTGLTENAVKAALRRNPQWFACVGTHEKAKLWRPVNAICNRT